MKKFVALRTKCLEFKIAANEAKGKQPNAFVIPSSYWRTILPRLADDILLKLEVSLGNTLLQVKGLDAKLKANNKAIEEAQTCLAAAEAKHKEELATAKQAAARAVKEAEERAAAAEDAFVGPCPSTWRCVGSPTSAQEVQHVSTVDRGSHPTAEVPP
jgi:hypothetical protein